MAGYTAPGGAIFVVATRVSVLDPNGFPAPNSQTFATNTMIKATIAPTLETGDDIAIKGASGDLVSWAKHGDMIKYGTITFEIGVPDPLLESACTGATVLNDTSAALTAPTGTLTATAQTTLGTLANGTYGYRASQFNAYGDSVPVSEVTAAVTGPTGAVLVEGLIPNAGALGIHYYGRTPGGEQLMYQQANIGSQATSAASGTGTVTSLSVTALTKPIPAGYTFTITGDTNTPKIVFTTTAAAGVGATVLAVTAPNITTTIAAAAIVPCFLDTGAVLPNGALPLVDGTAGPGFGVGNQEPVLGAVANNNGVSLELWAKRIVGGYQATDYPFWRIIVPKVVAMHIQPRDYTNANTATIMEGFAWENPNWGSGPFGDWQFDSSRWAQRAKAGYGTLPTPGFAPVAASY